MSWWNAKYTNNDGEYEITFASKDYEKAKAVEKVCCAVIDKYVKSPLDVESVLRCRECKHLNVVNRKELYAHCPKTNTVFLPFELDTREHFCSLGDRKEGADNDT